MGFLIPEIELPETGQIFYNAYASVSNNKIRVEKYVDSQNFFVDYTFYIWADLDARIAKKTPIASKTYSFVLLPQQLINNIFVMVYNDIKSRHPDFVEHI